ncbi:MAG: 50S ribosomal protein L4, partial [bacterium]|nr:50S ribosomal protein L4 [bacterium]
MSIALYNLEGKKVKDLQVPEALVQGPVRKGLIYYVVNYQRAKKRAGTHDTRTRGQVRGSTRKIYRQKGTGRARHGDRKANIFTGGGAAFGPHPRNYAFSMPKTARRRGLQTVMAHKNNEGQLMVVEKPSWSEPKTKQALEFFKKLGVNSALLVVDEKDSNIE